MYLVLSRVRTRPGLFLGKKLDLKKKCKVPEKWLSVEERMKEKEERYLGTLFFALESGQPDFWKIRSTLFWALVLRVRA